MIKSAYLDTSVFGGYFDTEFSEPTVSFFNRIISDKIVVVTSEILNSELENAPTHVKNLLQTIPQSQIQNIDVTPEIEQLAKRYIYQKRLSAEPVLLTVSILPALL